MDGARLIDANKLMKELFETSLWDNQDEDVFADLIENQPTAYDVDNVVEQLKESRVPRSKISSIMDVGENFGLNRAIEIVKGGVE